MFRVEPNRLLPLLKPSSLAIIGASESKSGWGYASRLMENVLNGGFPKTKIYPINPKYGKINDLICFKSLRDLPEKVDLAVIILSGRGVLPALNDCVSSGVKAALIISAGFAEAGDEGKLEQYAIKQLARSKGLIVCGPNSLGLAVPKDKTVIHAYMNLPLKAGPIGLISQSGAMAFASIVSPALDRDIHFSHVVSTGNEADLESTDFIRYLLQDSETKAIVCFLEGFKEAHKFREVAEEALRIGKPILTVKVGRSALGSKQAISHTGALTGSDKVYQAIFEQTGVIRLPYPEDLSETANLFSQCPSPRGDGLLIVSTSGGLCSLLADMCGAAGLDLPPLTADEGHFIRSREYLLFYGDPINPLDIRGQGATQLVEILSPFITDDRYGVIVIALGLPAVGEISEQIAISLKRFSTNADKPVVVLWMGNKLDKQKKFRETDGFRQLEQAGIPVFYSPEKLIRALKAFLHYHHFRKRWLTERAAVNGLDLLDIDVVGAQAFLARKVGVLDEFDSRKLLSFYGISSPREEIVLTAKEAVEAADRLGYPVVVKILSPDLLHKTEAKAVRLNLKDPEAVFAAAEQMLQHVRENFSKTAIRGLLVQEMITGAREMMVGISRDDQFGLVVAAGLGGIWIEALEDVTMRVPPLSRLDAQDMIKRLKGFKLLGDFRGMQQADLKALEDVILRLSLLALNMRDMITELDVNPLLILEKGKGAIAADALVRLHKVD
jgi:acetyltransferase